MIIKSSGGVFDNILENSINNPKTELNFKTSPSIKKDSAFLNYINTRKIEKRIDYLLLTAYYFTQYEQKPRFTLKQLNAKLMQNIAEARNEHFENLYRSEKASYIRLR